MALNGTQNPNASSQPNDCGIKKNAQDIVLSVFYFTIFPPALILNLTVAWICLHLQTKSTFMVYLKHLVAADLIMTLILPIQGANELPGVSPGLRAFDCRFSSVFFYLAMNMSVILMGLISLDRYLKIVRSGGSRICQSLVFSNVLTFTFWIVLFSSTTLPIIITTDQDPMNETDFCIGMKSELGLSFHKGVTIVSQVIFWTVCILIVFCYTCIAKKVVESYRSSKSSNDKKTRKVKLQVFLIFLVFVICYVPYYCIRVPYTELQVKEIFTCLRFSLEICKHLTLYLLSLNVCLNPLIYFFLCEEFRGKFGELCQLKGPSPSGGKNNDATPSSNTSK